MKKLWYSTKTIIYTYLIQYIMIFISVILYLIIFNKLDIINYTILYKYLIIALTLSIIPISIYLYRQYHIKETKINIKNILVLIPLSISISLFYNMLVFNYLNSKTIINLNIFILIVYTSIIGPIYEELIYRYISLRKAKEVYSPKEAILIITIIFALMHTNIINIIYAFILGLLLSYVYLKYKNIIYPITIHIIANLTSFFINKYNLYLLIISFIILIIYYIYMKKKF